MTVKGGREFGRPGSGTSCTGTRKTIGSSAAAAAASGARLASPSGFTAVAHTFVMSGPPSSATSSSAYSSPAPPRHGYRTPSGSTCFSPTIPSPRDSGALGRPIGRHREFRLQHRQHPLGSGALGGSISFGGVVSFILADLLIIPILVIYRRYYGRRMAWFIFGTFYASMVAAGYVVEFAFQPLGLVPTTRHANIGQTAPSWNYTTWLNIVFLFLAAALLWRFFTTGGRAMLAMMGGGPDDMADHQV